jgi:transcriptional regulator with XRE-family HTH domain
MPANDPAYSKRWHHERAHGLYRLTPAGPARAHVQTLLDGGWSQRAIADCAGVSNSTVHALVSDVTRLEQLKKPTAAALLAVTEAMLVARSNPLGFVLRVGAKRRVQALLAIGHRHADITDVIRSNSDVRVPSQLILSQRGEWITRATHDAIAAAYDVLSMRPGCSTRSKSRAEKHGFVPPLAWDDETIDNPLAQPFDSDDDEATDALDEIAVERMMAGTLRLEPYSRSPERIEAIRRLAALGLTDVVIGERVGMTGEAVVWARLRQAARDDSQVVA